MTHPKKTPSGSPPNNFSSDIQYQAIVEAQGNLITRAKPNGELIFVNQAYCRFFNTNPQQVIGQNFKQFLSPENQKKVETHYTNLSPKNPIVRYQEQILNTDRRERWLEWTDLAIFDSAGKLLEIQSVGRDISEYKEAEQTLRDNQAQLTAIIGGAMDAIITIDESQKIILFNQSAQKMFLCSEEAAIGQAIARFIPERFHTKHRQYIKQFGETGITNRQMNALGAIWGVRANGDEFPIEASISQVKVEGRKLYTVILRDITEKVKVERQMEETKNHLQKQNEVLLELAQTQAMVSGNLENILKEISSAAANTLEVEQVNIWLFDKAKSKITCIESYSRHSQKHTQGGELLASEYPAYFKALSNERTIAVHNALRDPRTQELGPTYLRPNNISSLLDTPIMLQGDMVGVICHEHKGPAPRLWKPEEQRFAASMADLIALALEIRNHQQAQQALRDSEIRYRAIVEDQTEFIVRSQPNGTITFVNRAYCAYFKKPYREFIGQNFFNFMSPPRRQIVRQKIARLTPQNPVEVDEHWATMEDGSLRCLHWLDRGIFDANGQLIELQSVGRDITQRRSAQEALSKSETRFRALIENALDIITILEANGDIRYQSPSIEAIMGYKPEEMTGLNAFNFIHPKDLPSVWNIWRNENSLSERQGLEIRFLHKNGSWRTIEAIGQNLLNDPAIEGIVINARDITERKQLQEQLTQVQKMDAIGRLAGGIAHDFNNLLVPIMGYADLGLLMTSKTDKPYRYFESIKGAAQHASGLTQQILTFSKQQLQETKTLNLNKIIINFKEMLRRLIGEDISIEYFLAQKPALIKADSSQLEQILLNLAINARDAMPEGGKLSIETAIVTLDSAYTKNHPSVSPGPYIMLAISDTGHGMDSAVKSQIFEPFFTTKTNHRGVGLGLATVHGIVKQHQGHIWVYSEPQKGTSFKLYFPEVKRSKETLEGKNSGPTPPPRHKTILLVEDEDMVRELVLDTLSAQGLNVLPAPNPLEALKISEAYDNDIHLLLTDVIMPHMNGRELYHQLTQNRPDMQVLYMSGYTNNVIIHQGISGEDIHFLQKPFTISQLLQAVGQALTD